MNGKDASSGMQADETRWPVVVYGSTGPLGAACARLFARRGWPVAGIARNEDRLFLLQKETGAAVFTADMADEASRTAARTFIEQFLGGKVPAVFLFAIGSHRHTLPGCGEAPVQDQIRVNIEIPLQEALHWAGRLPGGQFVFFGDAAVLSPAGGYSAYGAAKAGLMAAARILARDLAPGFRVNAVAPGIMNLKPTARPDALERWSVRVPLGHIGSPEDIARAVAFLVDHAYLTGVVLPVDGGFSLR